MKTPTSLPAVTIFAMALCMVATQNAWAQSGRTIKLIVPAPPGASTDFVARLSADYISRVQGVSAVVENRAGANGMIGVDAVSRTAPDGNTLLVTANTYLLDDLLRKPNYHPVTSFEPVCFLVQTPAVLVVNSASPYRTLKDLLDAAKAKPGELSVAAVGPGSTFQLGLLELTRKAGVNVIYVPYAGSAPAVTAALGNHVTAAISGYAVVVEQIKAGKLRALASGTAKRIEPQPELPTFDESGFKGLEIDNFFGVVAPAKTPKNTLDQLASWFMAALQAPESKAKLAAQYLYTGGPCGADYGAYLRNRHDEYGKAIRDANIKVQ
jgi:tripartite-type tricarboxylate transporter receptor subunit TctC